MAVKKSKTKQKKKQTAPKPASLRTRSKALASDAKLISIYAGELTMLAEEIHKIACEQYDALGGIGSVFKTKAARKEFRKIAELLGPYARPVEDGPGEEEVEDGETGQ